MLYWTGCMAMGDFSTPLRFARNDGTRDWRQIRRETSDGPFGSAVGSLCNHIWPPLLVKPYNRAFGAKGKHADQAAPVGNAPLSPPRGTSTRRGKFALHSVFALISNARHSAGKSAPSGGKVVRQHQKGCISIGRQPGWHVFLSRQGRSFSI